MKIAATIVAMLAIASSAEAQSRERFDLICDGTLARTIGGTTEQLPWSGRYAVDLGRGKFCEAGCDAPETIRGTNDRTILLRFSTYIDGQILSDLAISRIDGRLTGSRRYTHRSERIEATCTRGTFTAFPTTMF